MLGGNSKHDKLIRKAKLQKILEQRQNLGGAKTARNLHKMQSIELQEKEVDQTTEIIDSNNTSTYRKRDKLFAVAAVGLSGLSYYMSFKRH